MSGAIERVACAIRPFLTEAQHLGPMSVGRSGPIRSKLAAEAAGAAIRAMCDPELVSALAQRVFVDGEDPGYAEDFTAMLEAALTPTSKP